VQRLKQKKIRRLETEFVLPFYFSVVSIVRTPSVNAVNHSTAHVINVGHRPPIPLTGEH